MAISTQFIAQRLCHARELQSLSPDTIAELTGITPTRLLLIESGGDRPSGDEVLILAHCYRHDFRDFLDEGRPEPFRGTDILYRRHGDAFAPKDRRAIQEFLFLCEIESFLEDQLQAPKHVFAFKPKGAYFKGHAETAAADLRVSLGYASNAVPRDVYADFRAIGIHVFRRRLESSEISGLYIEHPVAGHCVLVNYEEDIYRQRFSVSHEAAHAIFDSSDAVVVTFRRESSRYDIKNLKEIRANRFASCYLMPPSVLPRNVQWTGDRAVEWAQKFRVSSSALGIALKEADLIDDSTAREIGAARVPLAEKSDPEAPTSLTGQQRKIRLTLLERGLSDYYVGLCFDAHQRGLITAGRLSEALLADHAETRIISALYGRAIRDGI